MNASAQSDDDYIAIASAVVESVLSQTPVVHSPFRVFLFQYVNAIINAMKRLEQPITHQAIVSHGINIEALIKDYMSSLAAKHDPKFESHIQVIKADLEQSRYRRIFVESDMFERDLYVVALWQYCKDQDLYDSVASILARTYEYNFRYYRDLVDAFLSIHIKRAAS